MATDDKKPAAVYVGWITFKNTLDQLGQVLPNRIDKSAFPGQSWGVKAQLMAGLQFLALVDKQGNPSESLRALAVADEGERKKQLEIVLRDRYAKLFALDLEKATPDQLSDEMRDSYNVSGDTSEKAVRFFLGALGYLDIPVSPLLRAKGGGGNGSTPRARRARAARKAKAQEPPPPPATVPAATAGTSKVFQLRTPGAELTVSSSLDFMKLVADDRKLFFELVGMLEAYEKGSPAEEEQGSDKRKVPF